MASFTVLPVFTRRFQETGDGEEQLMDVVFEAETLSHPAYMLGPETGQETSGPERFRLGDISVFDGKKKREGVTIPMGRQDLNLMIEVVWQPWGCCSSCCYAGMKAALWWVPNYVG